MGNGKMTCVLLGTREQERKIQNAQVNFIKVWKSKSPHKRMTISCQKNEIIEMALDHGI